MTRCKHKGVVGGCGGKLHITVNALVGMNDGMDFYATFLLSCLRMAAYALEYDVGKQGYGRGINNPQPFHPFLRAVTAAVRRKFVLVRLVKVAVNILEELLRASGVGIGQSAAPGHLFIAYVMEFAHLCRHRCLYLAQGVEAHDDGIQHREQMSEPVETLHVLLTAVFAAHFNNFITVE